MRTNTNTNAVVNVVDRQDRVIVIASTVTLCLRQFGRQLLYAAASLAKPSAHLGAHQEHVMAKCWLECLGGLKSGFLMTGWQVPTGMLGHTPEPATVRTAS